MFKSLFKSEAQEKKRKFHLKDRELVFHSLLELTFKWKLATIGNFFIDSCLVDSWYESQELHLILAEEPKCSGRVNRSKQSMSDFGVTSSSWRVWELGPKSSEMSQKGSIVVDTPLQDWQTTSDWRPPVNIWSIMQLHWWGLFEITTDDSSPLQWRWRTSRVAIKNSCASCCS